MKKVMLLLSVLSLMLINPAPSISSAQDNQSSALLSKLSKTYKTYKSVKATFTIDVKNKQTDVGVKQSGILYQKAKKFRITMSGQEIYCDGKTIWTYLEGANEVQISKFDPKTMDINYSGQITRGSQKIDVVELTPLDKTKGYFKVKLGIDKMANKVKEMSVYSKNGMVTTYDIQKFEPNVAINDAYFKFNPKEKPGVIEIDLR